MLLAAAMLGFAPFSASAQGVIVDSATRCGTSNPLPRAGESIRWEGACRSGLLQGSGTLSWFQDGKIRERNEGTFIDGELDGQATTSFPDGTRIVGQYARGVRHGEFVIRRPRGNTVRAIYEDGKLISERTLRDDELREFRESDNAEARGPNLRPTPGAAAAVVPSVPAQAPAAMSVSSAPPAQVAATPAAPRPVVAPTAPAPRPAVAAPPPAVAPMNATAADITNQRLAARGGIDKALNDAAALERAGRTHEAAQLYSEIAAAAIGLPAGLMAARRAAELRPPPPPSYATTNGYPAPRATPAAAPVRSVAPPPPPPPAAAPMSAAFAPPAPVTGVAAPAPLPGPSVAARGGVDRALEEAMALERAGRNLDAARLYAEIAASAIGTPNGLLAARRAAELQAPGTLQATYTGAPLPLEGTTQLAHAANRVVLVGKSVCSARGVFSDNANWCGRVLREEGNDVEVEVRTVRTNRTFGIGFSAAPCTGNVFLSVLSEGRKIWVSRGCLEGNP